MASNKNSNKIINKKEYWLPDELWQEVLGFVGVLTALPNPNNRKVRWTLFKHLQFKDLQRTGLGGMLQKYNVPNATLRFKTDGSDNILCGKKQTSVKEFKFNIRKAYLVGGFNRKIIMKPKFWYDLNDTLVRRLGPAVVSEVGDVWQDGEAGRRASWVPQTIAFSDGLYTQRLTAVPTPNGGRWSGRELAKGMLFNIPNYDIEYKITKKLKSRIKFVVNKITLNRSRPPSQISWSTWELGGSNIYLSQVGHYRWQTANRSELKSGPEVDRAVNLLGRCRNSISPTLAGSHEEAENNMMTPLYQTDRDELLQTLFNWAITAAEDAGVVEDFDGNIVLQGRLLHYVMGDPSHEWTLDTARFKRRCLMLNNNRII